MPALIGIYCNMSGSVQLPQGQMRPPLAAKSRCRVGGPNTGRPTVSDSCTRVEPTGDKRASLQRRQRGKAEVSLGVSLLCRPLTLERKQTGDRVPGDWFMSRSTIGGAGDTTIMSPGWSSKLPLPGIGLHDPLYDRQAYPEFTSFYLWVGQICPREELFSCRPLSKREQICDIPDPPIR